jgi:flagellar hook-associated protein 3 FlgL
MTTTRITNMMISNQIVAEINASQNTLDRTEEELSSGLTINEPSDDPSGAGLAVQLNGQLSDISRYSDNATDASGWTGQATTALTTIENDMQRVQELVTEAGNGTNSATDLQNISEEVSQLQASISTALGTQYNGQSVFTGVDSGSSTTAVTRLISPGTTVTVNVDASSLLNPTDGSSGLMATLDQIQDDLNGTNGGSSSNLNTTDLSNLQANLAGISQLQTEVGATSDQVTMAQTSLQSMTTSVTSELSDDEDVNYATAETDYSDEEAAFEAALKAGASIVQDSLMDFLDTSG